MAPIVSNPASLPNPPSPTKEAPESRPGPRVEVRGIYATPPSVLSAAGSGTLLWVRAYEIMGDRPRAVEIMERRLAE
jgi:hypothetical protein